MISVFGRYLVGSEAGVERGYFFPRLGWRLSRGDIFAGEDRLGASNIGLPIDANTEE